METNEIIPFAFAEANKDKTKNIIKVIGVGGGGSNAVINMCKEGVHNVRFAICNTDSQALAEAKIPMKIQLGSDGLGVGGKPEKGKEAAEASLDSISSLFEDDTEMVFIACGMGGGTGTGAAPVIAEIARDMGILTVGVVTKPFEFEREQKMNQAMKGIDEMRKHVDALVIIPNQRLLQLNEKQLTFQQAFIMVDDVLHRTVKIVSDMVNKTAVINVDFSDLSTIIKDAGDAHIAIGTGTGDKKVEEAVQQVVNSPLLETSIKNAGRLLTYITLSQDALMTDVNDAMQAITKACGADAEIIFGANYGPADMKDSITISVIATCFKEDAQVSAAPSVADEIIGSSVGASTGSSFADFLSGTKTLSTDDSGYSDLEAIFKNRN